MHLWNDYEGTTLAGQWKLGRLLRTEGRSALFATTQADGSPAVLRLTEALNDQAVLQARYRAIQTAGDRYLIAVNSFGDAELDGTPLSYAVLEPTQESLADIVATRRLAPEEVHEVAAAVAGGLLALHGQGLVHGLVEPESVLAAGDRIKLRSDCARPAPSAEDAALEGAITAQTDAYGLAGVLYRALTQERLHDAADALALPEPFATIVRNIARGMWGVPQIEAELQRYHRAHTPVVPVPVAPREPVRSTPEPMPPTLPVPSGASIPVAKATTAPILFESTAPLSSRAKLERNDESAWQQPEPISGSRLRLILIAAAAILLLLIAFLLFHHKANSGGTAISATPAAASLETPPATQPPAPASPQTASIPPAKPSPSIVGQGGPSGPGRVSGSGEKVWRVVAYTYNRQSMAEQKAASLNEKFPGFNAQAWSRTGQGPFLVTLGGEMPKDEAFTMRAKARHAGVAPDVYAQNYAR